MGKIDAATFEINKPNDQSLYFQNGIQGISGESRHISFNATSAGNATTSGYGSSPTIKREPVVGIPYECPNCGHRMSFRS